MRKVLSAAEMREIDRLTTERYSLPSFLLMEAAANAAARALAARFAQDLSQLRVLILCGRGNNGGDGAALARTLWTSGAGRVEVLLFGRVEETRGDARINFETIRELAAGANSTTDADSTTDANETTGLRTTNHSRTTDDSRRLSFAECVQGSEWSHSLSVSDPPHVIVDALFGTGLARPLEGVFKEVVSRIASLRESVAARGGRPSFVLSLDLPSGLDADSPAPIGASVQADVTVTFTAPKPANVLPPASHSNGHLVVADIGSPAALVDESPSRLFLVEPEDVRAWLRATRYAPDSYKNTHGHVLVIAGSRELTGAAVLCADSAMRSGAGLVTVAAPISALASVAARVMPEVMTAGLAETADGAISSDAFERAARLAERADVIAIGPGLTSNDESTRRFVRALVERRAVPIVIDADGLNSLAPWPDDLRGSGALPLVLTPHVGEMRRLLGVDDNDALKERVGAAREFASAHKLILVLKGSRTITAAPDGCVFVNATGNAGLGTAGAGDTLTGVIAGFIAQARGALKDRADVLGSVLAAVYVGGLAGDLAACERGMRTMVASDVREHLGAAVRALDAEGERPA